MKIFQRIFILICLFVYFYACSDNTVTNNPTTNTDTVLSGWFRQPSGMTKNLYDVYFLDSTFGWIAGDSGVIMRTTSGGSNWFYTATPNISNINAIKFTSSMTGYAVGSSGTIYRCIDGGDKWNLLSSPTPNSLSSLFFLNDDTGWICGITGVLFRTTDKGVTWLQGSFGSQYPDIKNVYFTSFYTGFVSCYDGLIFKTTDGGANWSQKTSPEPGHSLNSILFINSLTGFAGGNALLRSTDGGEHWNSTGYNSSLITELFFPGAEYGYAVTSAASVLKTTDSGVTWSIKTNSLNKQLHAVYFINNFTGWCVGDSGLVFKTTTGGE